MAAANGHSSMVDTLLNAGAVCALMPGLQIAVTGMYGLLQATASSYLQIEGRVHATKVLLGLVDCRKWLVVIRHSAVSSALQEPGAKNSEGNTPLHYACLNGHMAIVRQLMMNGASASELNRYGSTDVFPLMSKTPSHAGQVRSSSISSFKSFRCAKSFRILLEASSKSGCCW